MFDKIRKIFILTFLVASIYLLGFYAHSAKLFPYKIIGDIKAFFKQKMTSAWYYFDSSDTLKIVKNTHEALDWPILISSISDNDSLIVKIINNDGKILHKWNLEWFDIWNNADHLPKEILPKQRPGTHIHGIYLFDDGSIVFNFEHCGLVRIDWEGNVIWKLPLSTDHSVVFDGSILWVCAQKYHSKQLHSYPNFVPPFTESFLLKVSKDGEVLEETSIFDLMLRNNLEGLLYNASKDNFNTRHSGDILHLNDVEPFPINLKEGFFKHGDVMISLRNINTIIIYNDSTKVVKNVTIGGFVRQHDPDFIDGDHISLFDNYNIGYSNGDGQSRILVKSFTNNQTTEYFRGSDSAPFFSSIMGKHQWLENGNLLITDSMHGRAFEINQKKEIVWDYRNVIDSSTTGLMEEATRFPPEKLQRLMKNRNLN
jgi:hypothetical protein